MSIQELKFFKSGFVIYNATKRLGLVTLSVAKGIRHTIVYLDIYRNHSLLSDVYVNVDCVNQDKFGLSADEISDLQNLIRPIVHKICKNEQDYVAASL